MERRKFLKGVGATVTGVSFAGCVTPELRSIGESVSVSNGSITLTEVRVETFLSIFRTVHSHIVAEDGIQYIVFEFDVSSLNVKHKQNYLYESVSWSLGNDESVQVKQLLPLETFNKDGVASVVFELPSPHEFDSGVVLEWQSSQRVLWDAEAAMSEAGVLSHVSNPPDFEVKDIDIPTTTDSDSVDVTLTVENTGGSTGEFKAKVGSRAISSRPIRSIRVPAGETATRTFDVMLYTSGKEQVEVDWHLDSEVVTVTRQ